MRYGSSVRRRRSGCPTPEVSASAAGCIRPDLSGRRHAHQAGKGPTQRAQPRWGGSGSRRRAPGALQEVARGPVPGEDCWGGAASVARLAHGRGGATPRGSVRVPGGTVCQVQQGVCGWGPRFEPGARLCSNVGVAQRWAGSLEGWGQWRFPGAWWRSAGQAVRGRQRSAGGSRTAEGSTWNKEVPLPGAPGAPADHFAAPGPSPPLDWCSVSELAGRVVVPARTLAPTRRAREHDRHDCNDGAPASPPGHRALARRRRAQ